MRPCIDFTMTLNPRICLPVKIQGCAPRGGLVTDGCWDEIMFHDFISTAIRNNASTTLNCVAAPVPSANHALLNTHAQYRLTCARWHTHAHSYTETSSTRAWKDLWCMQTVQKFISLCPLCYDSFGNTVKCWRWRTIFSSHPYRSALLTYIRSPW